VDLRGRLENEEFREWLVRLENLDQRDAAERREPAERLAYQEKMARKVAEVRAEQKERLEM
jgi:hypothetical protein